MHAMEDYHAGTGTVEAIRLKRQGRMGESLHLEVKQHLLMGGRPVAQPPTETLETLGPAEGSLSLHIALKVDRSSCRARDLQGSAFVKGFTRFLGENGMDLGLESMGPPAIDETTGALSITLNMLGLPDNVMRSIGPCRRLERLDCIFQLYSSKSPSSASSQSQSQPSSLAHSQQQRRKNGTPLKQQMLAPSEPEAHLSSLMFRTLLHVFGKLATKYPLVFNTKHAERLKEYTQFCPTMAKSLGYLTHDLMQAPDAEDYDSSSQDMEYANQKAEHVHFCNRVYEHLAEAFSHTNKMPAPPSQEDTPELADDLDDLLEQPQQFSAIRPSVKADPILTAAFATAIRRGITRTRPLDGDRFTPAGSEEDPSSPPPSSQLPDTDCDMRPNDLEAAFYHDTADPFSGADMQHSFPPFMYSTRPDSPNDPEMTCEELTAWCLEQTQQPTHFDLGSDPDPEDEGNIEYLQAMDEYEDAAMDQWYNSKRYPLPAGQRSGDIGLLPEDVARLEDDNVASANFGLRLKAAVKSGTQTSTQAQRGSSRLHGTLSDGRGASKGAQHGDDVVDSSASHPSSSQDTVQDAGPAVMQNGAAHPYKHTRTPGNTSAKRRYSSFGEESQTEQQHGRSAQRARQGKGDSQGSFNAPTGLSTELDKVCYAMDGESDDGFGWMILP